MRGSFRSPSLAFRPSDHGQRSMSPLPTSREREAICPRLRQPRVERVVPRKCCALMEAELFHPLSYPLALTFVRVSDPCREYCMVGQFLAHLSDFPCII